MKRKQIKMLLGGLSFTTALFVFQACYGMPQDMQDDLFIQGKVVSQNTKLPIEGIKIKSDISENYSITNTQGEFAFYAPWGDSMRLSFEDTDPDSGGDYISKDTLLTNPEHEVFLNIALEEN
jgi:hypothetical protein